MPHKQAMSNVCLCVGFFLTEARKWHGIASFALPRMSGNTSSAWGLSGNERGILFWSSPLKVDQLDLTCIPAWISVGSFFWRPRHFLLSLPPLSLSCLSLFLSRGGHKLVCFPNAATNKKNQISNLRHIIRNG